jgi:hypothetical protein
MKITLSKTLFGLAIVFGLITYIFDQHNTYMRFKQRKCIILDKLITPPGYKHSADLYLVLKEERGIVFDLNVAPATYSQHKIGDTIHFTLRDFDIKQTRRDNTIYFFGQVLLFAISTTLTIAALGSLAFKSARQ